MSLLKRIAEPQILSSILANLHKQAKKKPALKEELTAFDPNTIQTISHQLITGTYEPSAQRSVYQLKTDGGVQSFGVPVITDRIVLAALYETLTERWDRRFCCTSIGGRRGFGRHSALPYFEQAKQANRHWIVKTDIYRYFYSVNHQILLDLLAKQPFLISKDLRQLISKILTAGTRDLDVDFPSTVGVPPGVGFFRLLANVYLYPLDVKFKDEIYCRYVDDVICFARTERQAIKRFREIKAFVKKELDLSLSAEKTRIVHRYRQGVTFLGYEFKGDHLYPGAVNIKRFKQRIKKITDPERNHDAKSVIKRVNQAIAVFARPYKTGTIKTLFNDLDGFIRARVRQFLKMYPPPPAPFGPCSRLFALHQ